jgi:hypothetical protein
VVLNKASGFTGRSQPDFARISAFLIPPSVLHRAHAPSRAGLCTFQAHGLASRKVLSANWGSFYHLKASAKHAFVTALMITAGHSDLRDFLAVIAT